MSKSLVSVIIPAYNSENYIFQTLESVISQTYKNLEIIVIDDGSIDGTQKIVQSFDDKRINYFYQKNKGLAGARNAGIEKSNGKYLAFIDSDDIWPLQKIEKQIKLFKNEKIGLTYTGRQDIDSFGNTIFNKQSKLYSNNLAELIKDNFITVSSVIVRKNVLTKNDLLFSTDRPGVEDYDLWFNLFYITQSAHINQKLLYYRVHENQMSSNFKLMHGSIITTYKDVAKNIVSKFKGAEKGNLLYLLKGSIAYNEYKYGMWLFKNNKKVLAQKYLKSSFRKRPYNIRHIFGLLISRF